MKNKTIKFDDYTMRQLKLHDTENYYKYAFAEADSEAKYYTGTITDFTKEQIVTYVKKIEQDNTRFDFIILKDEEIIGEVVLSDIEDGSCHYRICIYKKSNFSKGIGFKATNEIFRFAFEELQLEAVELEVFPFNKRGISLYKKMGFKITEEIIDEEAEEPYRNIILMKLIKEDYNY